MEFCVVRTKWSQSYGSCFLANHSEPSRSPCRDPIEVIEKKRAFTWHLLSSCVQTECVCTSGWLHTACCFEQTRGGWEVERDTPPLTGGKFTHCQSISWLTVVVLPAKCYLCSRLNNCKQFSPLTRHFNFLAPNCPSLLFLFCLCLGGTGRWLCGIYPKDCNDIVAPHWFDFIVFVHVWFLNLCLLKKVYVYRRRWGASNKIWPPAPPLLAHCPGSHALFMYFFFGRGGGVSQHLILDAFSSIF